MIPITTKRTYHKAAFTDGHGNISPLVREPTPGPQYRKARALDKRFEGGHVQGMFDAKRWPEKIYVAHYYDEDSSAGLCGVATTMAKAKELAERYAGNRRAASEVTLEWNYVGPDEAQAVLGNSFYYVETLDLITEV